MPLAPGTRLGPYEVTAQIGEGGMGEVYRARDTRLDRIVAVKVLPTAFADDAERRARFEREAKAVAALSHPNILGIHDTGEHAGQLFVVTELLDGETLREKLQTGALPVRKATDIAVQIARGLATAQDKGIVHRDLKPENVFLLRDGQVKILDFGLARQVTSPTEATGTAGALTDPGTVMGTVGYMAPEQVRGADVDARTDLFALGALLYEMLSGRRAFRRDTPAETMTAILREDPPELSTARADLPPGLERIVRHCLEKNPAERFQTARDVAFALETFSGTSISSSGAAAVPAAGRWGRPSLVAVLFAVTGLAAGYGFATWLRTGPGPTAIGFDTRTVDPQWITNMRFAPDGQTIVYSAAATGNVPSLFLLRQGSLVPQPVGQPGTHLLSVSRSGELAVLTGARFNQHRLFRGTLTRMTMDGAARPLMEGVREADWSPDGSSLAIVRPVGAKDRLEYPVDNVLYEVSGYVSDPRVSPDDSRVAFLEHPRRYDDRGWLKVVDRKGTVRTLAGEFLGAEGVAWSPDGKTVLFAASAPGVPGPGYVTHAVNADGPPVVRVALPSMTSAETMDMAADGRLLVNAGEHRLSIGVLVPGEATERELPWLDLPLSRVLSSDGKWLLFSDQSLSAGVNYAVAWRKTDGSPAVRLGEGTPVALSPDDKWALAFVSNPAPGRYVAYPTGPGQPKPLDFGALTGLSNASYLPDGQVFICGAEPGKPRRCYRKDLASGTLTAITPEDVVSGLPAPDGRTIAVATADRRWHIVDAGGVSLRPIPGEHTLDRWVGWSRDSRALFTAADATMPIRIDRIDISTGARTFVREVMPPDRSGVIQVRVTHVSHDGQAYAYFYEKQTNKVVVVSGVSTR